MVSGPATLELDLRESEDGARLTVTSADPSLVGRIKTLLELLGQRLCYSDPGQLQAMIDELTPLLGPPPPEALSQITGNVQARGELLTEFGALTSAEVHRRAGMGAANTAATAARWRKEGKVIAVRQGGRQVFPGFQFDAAGLPLPAVGEVVRLFDDAGWQTALWFATPNGWLDGRRPVDLLQQDPEAVVEAARREAENAF